jgi:hypothetical protein
LLYKTARGFGYFASLLCRASPSGSLLSFLGSKHLYLKWGDIIMKGLLTVLVLLAIVICGVGFYRGWFEFSTGKSEDKTTISVTVDKNKIKEDEEKAKDKMQDLGRQVKDKNQDKAHDNPERQP